MSLWLLFGWSFLAATIVPVGSEPALIAILLRDRSWQLPLFVATAGNVGGACTTYVLARLAVEKLDRRDRVPSRTEVRAVALMQRYGSFTLVLSWVPLIGDAIVAAAGAVKMPLAPFAFWTITGKFARYAFITYMTLAASS